MKDVFLLYDIGYVGTALIVLLLLGYRFFRYKRVHSIINVFFGLLIIMGVLEIISDIVSSITISMVGDWPIWIAKFSTQLFYLFQFVLPFLMFAFVFVLAGNPSKYQKTLVICFFPLFLALTTWIINPFVHTLFYFDIGNNYHRADSNEIVYISAAFYLIATTIFSIILRKEMGRRPSNIMIISSITVFVVVGVQFIYPQILTTGVGIMVSILLMYLYLRNSDSVTDTLTGCLERSALNQYLEGDLVSNKDCYGLVISLSGFKSVNTVFGIEAGDEILATLGNYLTNLTTVNKSDVYRLSGDVFLVLSRTKKHYDDILKDLSSHTNDSFTVNGLRIKVDCIILRIEGLNFYKHQDDLVQFIESSLEEAKAKKLSGDVLIDYKYFEQYEYNIAIERYLRDAIDSKLFYMNYQPIYNVKEGKYTMMEALVRLSHPAYGFIPPDKFVSIAEQNGLISEITNLILEMVSDFVKNNDLKKYGITNVKINLSAMDLLDDTLTSRIERIMGEDILNSGMIGFEITETVATSFNNEVLNFLDFINKYNLSLSMDDFGSGYANLDSALRVKYDVVKMDRSMLLAIDSSPVGKDVYKTIAKLFQKLGMTIVAEGCENIEQVNLLKKWNIDYIQGYYYSKPLNENDLIGLLAKNNKL